MVKCLDVSFICYAEHGFAASTFACRVTTSTLSDLYSAICSAIGTLRGPLHGGANEQAFYLIQSINDPKTAQAQILKMLQKKEKIMGFGHRVYKTIDPRAPIMKAWAQKLTQGPYGKPSYMKISDIIEEVLFVLFFVFLLFYPVHFEKQTMQSQKKLFPNVDFPVAMAYNQCGIPTELFTPFFHPCKIKIIIICFPTCFALFCFFVSAFSYINSNTEIFFSFKNVFSSIHHFFFKQERTSQVLCYLYYVTAFLSYKKKPYIVMIVLNRCYEKRL
ncbi:2-methylcitrate synthase [Reticulomyxa filosa]|uniref:Citrate synthase n=1 Tax=Reticulomyxa filosa TaxID=46433 RepID=X6NZW8_RETFI|nr:2-methylcitrate synthase [Reticulomyxa filosa]|eukprot:ETO30842.1 2-methylcitrate synthase [Reticulomyxa filosa]